MASPPNRWYFSYACNLFESWIKSRLKESCRASAFGQRIVGVLESKRLCKICSLGFEALLIGDLLGVTGHGWLRSWRRCTEKGFVGEEKSAKRDYMKEPSSEIFGSCIIRTFRMVTDRRMSVRNDGDENMDKTRYYLHGKAY